MCNRRDKIKFVSSLGGEEMLHFVVLFNEHVVVFTLCILFDYYCVVDLFSLPFSPISADWRAQVHGVTVTSAAAWWAFPARLI